MTDADYLDWFNGELWRALDQSGIASLSRLQRDLVCVMNFQAELNNGGMHQYLLNTSGDFAQETPDVFRRIGTPEAAKILEEANACFGPNGPPTDQTTRVAALLALPEQTEQRIHALSDAFYELEDCGLSLADLCDAYVLSQRDQHDR